MCVKHVPGVAEPCLPLRRRSLMRSILRRPVELRPALPSSAEPSPLPAVRSDGKTWGPMSTVVEGTTPCPGCPAAISNPNPVEVKLADGSVAILLHYDTMNNPSVKKHGLDRQIWSTDDGLTWEEDTLLAFPPEKNLGGLIGPSVGIQRGATDRGLRGLT